MESPQDLRNCVSMVEPNRSSSDDDGVIAAPPEATTTNEEPATSSAVVAEIPPEQAEVKDGEDEEQRDGDEESDWGDDDSYEYEDDDDVAFSGFLAQAPQGASQEPSMARNIIEEEQPNPETKRKWKEPTREAVNMSLRAERESTGSKRRLAQDLYRIMNQDTEEAGFSLEPKSEDTMDTWVIKLFQFDPDSNLAKDMRVLGIDHIELEMKFPDQYPFEPPFVRVVRPRFKRQTGFVMNGALCMELLTKDGWNPINDIESVIVSIRSLLVVGDGRLSAATELSEARYAALLEKADSQVAKSEAEVAESPSKKQKTDTKPVTKELIGSYTASEAQSAYSHLSDYHKKKGWDTSGWWARKG